MIGRFYFWVGFRDGSIRSDEERHAVDAIIDSTHEFFLPKDAISVGQGQIGVSDQGEGEFVFSTKLFMRGLRVLTYADNLNAGLPKRSVLIAKRAGLSGAARGVVFRVEVQQAKAFSFIATVVFSVERVGKDRGNLPDR